MRIHESEPIAAAGAQVVAAFPSVGLVATIAANFLIERLGLREVGTVDGPEFPTLSVVQNGEPLAPVRIYAGQVRNRDNEMQNLVVFLSEFQPNPDLVRPVAEAILAWADEKDAAVVVSPEGIVMDKEPEGDVFAIGSTMATRQVLRDLGVPLFQEGIIAGVTGVLLNLGKRNGFDVIGILSEAQKDYPDARSAATVVDVLAQVVDVQLDVSELFEEAAAFEQNIVDRVRRNQVAPQPERNSMYG